MRYAYDVTLEKWVALIDDIVIAFFDTEEEVVEYIESKAK